MARGSKDASLGILLQFSKTLLENRPELAPFEGSITKFLDLVAQAQEAAAQQAAFIASKQKASKRLAGLIDDAMRLLTVLRAALKEHYGIGSEKLAEFGIQPFRGRSRRPFRSWWRPPRVKPVVRQATAPAEPSGSES
jgi:hypothetical protein